MGKKLVAYFSASGTTRKIAEIIAQVAEADLYAKTTIFKGRFKLDG